MNPLLLLALIGGGAVVAYKLSKPGCPTTPPPNPFCPPGGAGIDWDGLQKTLGVHKSIDKNTDKWLAMVQTYGKAVPVYGWFVSAAAYGVRTLTQWLTGDDNSDENKANALKNANLVVDLGHIPVTPYESATMASLARQNGVDWLAVATADQHVEPYVATLIKSAGDTFRAWGGAPGVLPYAMPTLVEGHRGTCPDFSHHYLENVDLLKPIAAAIAYQYGVCDHIAEIVAASQWGVENFEKAFPWKTLAKGSGKCEPADSPGCSAPDLWTGSFYNDPTKMTPQMLEDGFKLAVASFGKLPRECPPGSSVGVDLPHGDASACAHYLKGPTGYVGRESHTDAAPSCGYYAYAAGMLAALTTASRLAGKTPPPAFTWWSVQAADGSKIAPPPQVAVAAHDAVAGGVKGAPDVRRLVGR